MTDLLHVLALGLAVFRLTEIVTMDRISASFRARFPHYLWGCPRCVSVWAGAVCTALWYTVPWLNWALALSWLYIVAMEYRAQRQEQARQLRDRIAYYMAQRLRTPISGGVGEPWQGIVDPSRAIDWSGAGVQGGIPSRGTICTTLNPGVTAAQIESALAGCPDNQTVKLNAGTYNLTAINFSRNSVTLRGAGPLQTILNFSSVANGCGLGPGRAVSMDKCAGTNFGSSGPQNTATWNCNDTGGICAKGRTTLTLSSIANLTVGSTIWLDQADDNDGWPAVGDVFMRNWGSGESWTRSSRGLLEGHLVTACGTTTPGAPCTSTTITISEGLFMPSFRSAQSPGAWWGNTGSIIHDAGIEDLTINPTSGGASAIYMINATNCWLKNVRSLRTDTVSGGSLRIINIVNGVHNTIRDSYLYGPKASTLVDVYGVSMEIGSSNLIENNIIHSHVALNVPNSAFFGNVWAYNHYNNVGNALAGASQVLHGTGGYELMEGNDLKNFSADNIHTPHMFINYFRNHLAGQALGPTGTESQAAFTLYAMQRFFNVIGNVAGSTQWSSYQSNLAHSSSVIYETGWAGTSSQYAGTGQGNDARTAVTLMRWGNWDSVTSINDTSPNDATGTRFVSGEVPSGITNFPNAVPGSQTLPASFYLSAKPVAWWATPWGEPAWPPIGPDVSSGTLNTATEPTGGHVNKIPARLCFDNVGDDPAFPTSSPRIKSFDAATCYTAGTAPPPPATVMGASPQRGAYRLRYR